MKNSLPLVSILIPVYNAEKFVSNTIESALRQTYTNTEIVIVDDGSTDSSWEIIEYYREKYPQLIKSFRQENKGACAARNKALKESSGDYIQWLDADDILDENKILSQLQAVDFVFKTDVLLSGPTTKFYTDLKKTKFVSNPLWTDLTQVEFLYTYLTQGFFIYPHAWLVNRLLIEHAGFWNEKLLINQDGEFFSRVVASSSFVKFVDKAKCFYRTGNLSSISSQSNKRTSESLIYANLEIVKNVNTLINNDKLRYASRIFLERFYSRFIYDDNEIPQIKLVKDKILELGGQIPPKEETLRFSILRKILGLSLARKVKILTWSVQRIVYKFLNRFP